MNDSQNAGMNASPRDASFALPDLQGMIPSDVHPKDWYERRRVEPGETNAEEQVYAADMAIQERLFLDHIRLVYSLARRLLYSEGGDASLVEFLRVGMIGLQHAAETYDTASRTPFAHHAAPYIRRAILYDLCSPDHLSTGVRASARRIAAAEEELTESLGRKPEEREVAWCLDMDVSMLTQLRSDIERARLASLRRASANVDGVIESFGELLTPSPDRSLSPPDVLLHEQDAVALKNAFLRLKEPERLVLSLLYYEALSIADAACVMQLSVPLVVQMRTKALQTLRRSFRPLHLVTDHTEPVA